MLGLKHRCSESASMLRQAFFDSMLDPNRVIAKNVNSCTQCCYVTWTVMQSKGWLSAIVCCNMAKINDVWDESMNKRKNKHKSTKLTSRITIYIYRYFFFVFLLLLNKEKFRLMNVIFKIGNIILKDICLYLKPKYFDLLIEDA